MRVDQMHVKYFFPPHDHDHIEWPEFLPWGRDYFILRDYILGGRWLTARLDFNVLSLSQLSEFSSCSLVTGPGPSTVTYMDWAAKQLIGRFDQVHVNPLLICFASLFFL